MKYLLASLIAACLIGGIVSAKNEWCSPHCNNPGPQGQGAEKGDRHIYSDPYLRESSSSKSDENDTSTKKHWPPVAR